MRCSGDNNLVRPASGPSPGQLLHGLIVVCTLLLISGAAIAAPALPQDAHLSASGPAPSSERAGSGDSPIPSIDSGPIDWSNAYFNDGPPIGFPGDLDCERFLSQSEAHDAFIAAGGPYTDPYNLDLDGDGIACEWLPLAPYGGVDRPYQRGMS